MRIALPNKGRLSEDARELLELAGLGAEFRHGRTLSARLGEGFEALFVRAQDIPEFVADGAVELGVTGHDIVLESGEELTEVLDLGFGYCRLVVAVPVDSEFGSIDAIPSGTRVATSFPRLARDFFARSGIEPEIAPLSGAAEIAPVVGVAEVVVDLVATGSTLRLNGLRELGTICESTARLVARPKLLSSAKSAEQVDDLSLALESVLRARGKRYLMANVPRTALDRVKELLPGLGGTTLVDIADPQKVAAHAVIDADDVYRTVAQLKAVGAEGILVSQIERLVP